MENQNMVKNKIVLHGYRQFYCIYKKSNLYKDIAEDVETRFHSLNDELDGPLAKGKNKKVIRLMKDKLGEKIMKKFVGLRAKSYNSLIDDGKKSMQ